MRTQYGELFPLEYVVFLKELLEIYLFYVFIASLKLYICICLSFMIILMCYFCFIIQFFFETFSTELYFYIFCFLDFYFHLIIFVVLFQKSCTVLDQRHVYMSLYISTYRSLVRPNSETVDLKKNIIFCRAISS